MQVNQIPMTTECRMCPLLVLVLILQFSISLPAVAGDCYDDPPNNKSYDNCATCYQTLANALLNTGDNKYQLSKAFFPDGAVQPVEVRAVYKMATECNYNCDSERDPDDNTTTTWYWLVGEFFVFQPLKIFVYRSLLFSPPSWRQECVVLCLPEQCLSTMDSVTSHDFFQFLTQRVCCLMSDRHRVSDQTLDSWDRHTTKTICATNNLSG